MILTFYYLWNQTLPYEEKKNVVNGQLQISRIHCFGLDRLRLARPGYWLVTVPANWVCLAED